MEISAQDGGIGTPFSGQGAFINELGVICSIYDSSSYTF